MDYNIYINKYNSAEEIQAALDEGTLKKPYIGMIEDASGNTSIDFDTLEPIDYRKEYLTFEILSAGTINWTTTDTGNAKTIYYSKNGGEWTGMNPANGDVAFNVEAGDKVRFKGNNATYGHVGYYHSFSGSTCVFNAYGNIMSLVDDTNYENYTTLTSENEYLLRYIFAGTNIVNAELLILPAITLVGNCYDHMFYGCTSLLTAPELPATTLARSTYNSMFQGCTSLTIAPELPATTLGGQYCYYGMFQGCTSLTTAPELPATTLEASCYENMFRDCTSLTTAPELPAVEVLNINYRRMFNGCSSLNYIKCLASSFGTWATLEWVTGVSATGTFVKSAGATWPTGADGIPEGWTVEEE